MRIGNTELNQNETEWAVKFADSIANQATKQAISALNAKFTIDDLKVFLAEQFTKKADFVEEPVEIAVDEELDEDEEF